MAKSRKVKLSKAYIVHDDSEYIVFILPDDVQKVMDVMTQLVPEYKYNDSLFQKIRFVNDEIYLGCKVRTSLYYDDQSSLLDSTYLSLNSRGTPRLSIEPTRREQPRRKCRFTGSYK